MGNVVRKESNGSVPITLKEQERWLSRRKAELGLEGRDYVPVNSGTRRTLSKLALLQAIEEGKRR